MDRNGLGHGIIGSFVFCGSHNKALLEQIPKYQSFIHSPTDALVSYILKNIKIYLKFTLIQLRHVSVQLHHHQGAQYSCLSTNDGVTAPKTCRRCFNVNCDVNFNIF